MRFALGMDNREIARALGRSDGATKVLIHRAIKQLQEEMGDERRVSRGESTWDVEALLGDVLRPIEPPERLSGRIEDTFTALTAAAATELSDWAEELSDSEMRALRDPRNWVRPVVAVGVGGVATGALVLFELRRRGKPEASGLKGLAGACGTCSSGAEGGPRRPPHQLRGGSFRGRLTAPTRCSGRRPGGRGSPGSG